MNPSRVMVGYNSYDGLGMYDGRFPKTLEEYEP